MNSRRKTRKSNKTKPKVDDAEKCNQYTVFNSNELAQIKSALKIKEVLCIPIAIGCVILNKLETLEQLIKSGVNINEIGPNNTTALIWAVKYKNLDIINVLLSNGADPNVKVENGENIIMIALEHKLWDEDTFMDYWHMVSKVSPIELNATNKNGHTILHIAVRREWEKLIKLLLIEKVDMNITNINGVTPLMTACFRNNANIVNILINNGANFTKEDNHYRTALCYAIVTGAKVSKPPFGIAERIIFELKKDFSFKEYIKRRIEIIDIIVNKERISEQEGEMLVTLIQYIVQYTENGLKIILEFEIFQLVQRILQKMQDDDKRKLMLQLTQELLCYNEQVVGFNCETQLKLSSQFLSTKIVLLCLEIIKNNEMHFQLAFYIVIMFCTLNELGQNWMQDNFEQFNQAYRRLPADYMNFFQRDFPEEKLQKLMRKKMKKLRKLISSLDEDVKETSKGCTEAKATNEKKSEPFFNIKKSKRRSKVLKAKLSKIKNMEIAERLSLKINPVFLNPLKEDTNILKDKSQTLDPDTTSITSQINNFSTEKESETYDEIILKHSLSLFSQADFDFYEADAEPFENENSLSMFELHLAREVQENEQLVNMFMTDDLVCPVYSYSDEELQNPITTSLKQFLQSQQDMQEPEDFYYVPTFPEWKSKIYKLPFNDWSAFGQSMKIDKKKLKAAVQYMKEISLNYDNTTNAIALDAALNVVDEYFKELLDIIVTRSKAHWDLRQDVVGSRNGKKSSYLEKHAVSELQANFHHLITSICSLAHSDLSEALRNIYQLESTLLRFPINGKTLMSDVCALEEVKIQYTTFSYKAESSFLSYVENVLNGFEDLREDIKITVVDGVSTILENAPPNLYANEMSVLSPPKPKNKRKELDAKTKTMEGAYHLTDSIERLIRDDDDPTKNKVGDPKNIKSESETKTSEGIMKILTKPVENDQLKDLEQSRWSEKIQQLHVMKQKRLLLGGDVKLCKYPDRNHVISQGGNFNIVTLGLGTNNQPLAVKKIPSKHCVSNILKTVVKPLLGLRHKNILHYFVCNFEESDLIIATPLCEYNIGQYVQLLKDSPEKDIYNLSPLEIVRQFLTGLAFLHQHPEPIIHGNLKPSNIFVDTHGVVRLAEFGINKTLFKLIEAPETSLIWFSQECYKTYKATSNMECSLPSDIQVAGMLIYFIVSYGVHPFGPEINIILKNLDKATFSQPPSRDSQNQIFADLVSWMLMYEPNDRPQINQILSHVLFWSNDRRWRFILNCSGISTNGVPLAVNTIDLHNAIDETSTKEQIKGHWVSIARRKFPKIKFQGDDTVVGFLKFINQFYETQMLDEGSLNELKNCVLTYFPAFPLTLYRILEATGMIKEYPFIAYTTTETILS